ncbi:MAG: hypothetical protein JJ958_13910 [Balneola sp.]|nr:hypothetical protein [Balneola sp.]
MSANSLTKIILLKRPDVFRKNLQLHRPLELLASQERNEVDGSEGAIITLWLILEYASYTGRPFVMISPCNGVRANNSCRELLVLEPVLREFSSGTKVHIASKCTHNP